MYKCVFICVHVYEDMCVCKHKCICVYTHTHASHACTCIHISLTWRRSAGSSPLEREENIFKIISILPLWKFKKREKERENGIFGFEIHDKIKDYNAHRFFKVYIINNTGKHITNQ